jgi:hypothetical protein
LFIVAIAELRGDVEREATPLAELLGVAAYDVKLWLAGALPRIVLQTTSRDEAESILRAIRARGHGALICDSATIVVNDVVRVKRLSVDATSMGASDRAEDRLLYDSIGALVHVANRTDVEHVTRENDLVSDSALVGRRPYTVVHERTSREHVLEHALFVFPVDALRPWVIHERETKYLGLGTAMRPTAHENFFATVELLRDRAPSAPYDDRFVASPRTPHRVLRVRGLGAPETTAEHGDPSVHLLALWLMRGSGGPYRDAAPAGAQR